MAEPVAAPVGNRTASGFAWFAVQAVGVKIVGVACQVALAYLLGSADYGYVSLAYLVATFASLIQQGGLRDMLIQRGREFDKWASDAFWMALAQGVASTVFMIVAAPAAAWFFHDQRLVGLILVLATQNVLVSLCVVPEAKLQLDLRFKFLAAAAFANSVGLSLLSVLFASLDHFAGTEFGPYSFILPWPIVGLMRAIILWRAARIPVRRPRFHLWRHMVVDNGVLLAATFFWTITWQGDYFILGRLYEKDAVGRYFWAFNLSSQTLQLLSLSVAGVLLPSLTRLAGDPQRQLGGFLRAANALSLLATPACLLQALAADPFVRLLFEPEWYPAIPVIQILSIGWAFLAVAPSAVSMLKAQGRFMTHLWMYASLAVVFLGLVYWGARAAGIVGAAWGVLAYCVIAGPISTFVAIRPLGGTWLQSFHVFFIPMTLSALTIGGSYGLGTQLHLERHGEGVAALIALLVGVPAYVFSSRLLAPEAWQDTMFRAYSILRIRAGLRKSAAA